jgi:hypothetical protein
MGQVIGTGGGFAGFFAGNVQVNGTVTQTSDRRLKSEIATIAPDKSAAILGLPLYSYVKHLDGRQTDAAMKMVVDGWRVDVQRMREDEAPAADIAALQAKIDAWDAEEWLPVQGAAIGRSMGPIAQELQAVAPELTRTDADGIIHVNDLATIYAMIAGLKAEIAALKAKP